MSAHSATTIARRHSVDAEADHYRAPHLRMVSATSERWRGVPESGPRAKDATPRHLEGRMTALFPWLASRRGDRASPPDGRPQRRRPALMAWWPRRTALAHRPVPASGPQPHLPPLRRTSPILSAYIRRYKSAAKPTAAASRASYLIPHTIASQQGDDRVAHPSWDANGVRAIADAITVAAAAVATLFLLASDSSTATRSVVSFMNCIAPTSQTRLSESTKVPCHTGLLDLTLNCQ